MSINKTSIIWIYVPWGILALGSIFVRPLDRYHAIGFAIAVPALVLWIIAKKQLGKAFAIMPRANELVTHGLYKYFRHPIYLFSTIAVTGIIIAYKDPLLLILVALLIIVEISRARREEQVLIAKFGQKYLDYKQQTWF